MTCESESVVNFWDVLLTLSPPSHQWRVDYGKHDYSFTFVSSPCWCVQALQHALAQVADLTSNKSWKSET